MDNTQFPPVPSTATQNQPGTASPMQTGSTATAPTSPTVLNPVAPRPLNPNAQAPLPVPPQPPQPPQPLSPTSPTPPVPSSSPEPTVTNPVATPPPTPIAPAPKRKIPRIIAVVIVLLLLAGGGAFAFKYFQKPAVAPADENLVQQMPEASDEAMVVDEMSGWETFVGKKYRFNHPDDYSVTEDETGANVKLLHSTAEFVSIYPVETLTYQNFTECSVSVKENCLTSFQQKPLIEDIVVGGLSAKSFYYLGGGVDNDYRRIETLTNGPSGNKIGVNIFLGDLNLNSENVATKNEIFDQILSTFEFVDSATVTESGWKNYTNTTHGFSIKYPTTIPKYQGEWEVVEYGSTIGFRPNTIREDSIWGVTIHQNATVESIATASGSQFPDRRQETQAISVNGKPATLITVTTSQDPAWIAKTVVIGDGNTLFSISNGAIEIPEFEEFYQSFAFTQ